MAKFQKGHKFAKGGLRNPPGGRPTKEKAKAKHDAAKMAQEFIEKNIAPVLKTYLDNAKGHWEKRWTEGKDPKEYEVWVVDAASTRHWIDKFVPPAKQTIEHTGSINFNSNLPDEE